MSTAGLMVFVHHAIWRTRIESMTASFRLKNHALLHPVQTCGHDALEAFEPLNKGMGRPFIRRNCIRRKKAGARYLRPS